MIWYEMFQHDRKRSNLQEWGRGADQSQNNSLSSLTSSINGKISKVAKRILHTFVSLLNLMLTRYRDDTGSARYSKRDGSLKE